jgi:hypothetical protein
MKAINPIKAAITLAVLLGAWHLCWATLVATGVAQSVIDLVFWMHFIKPVYVVGSFNFAIALLLIAVTAMLGFVVGFAFSVLWNKVHVS